MSFKKNKEDFVCENCGAKVKGDGYTNHCPKCLWSKHVDVDPGDRLSTCGGLMKPVDIEKKGDTYYITHQCTKCFFSRKNRVHKNDDFDKVIELSVKLAEERERKESL